MLHTYLTTSWRLRYPIIGAPMAHVGRGRLAHAVSQAGGLGMIGIGSTESVEFLAREAAIARGADQLRFGIGMHTWAIQKRPDLLEAAIEASPFLISISVGSPAPYVAKLHQHGSLLASPECENTENVRARIVQARETDTILTRAFDVAQGLAWPPQYPGRALRNRFTDQWHSHIDELPQANEARQQLAEAIASKNYDLAYIYAGEAVGLVTRQQSAGDVIQHLGEGAERLLRDRTSRLLEGHEASREEQEGKENK